MKDLLLSGSGGDLVSSPHPPRAPPPSIGAGGHRVFTGPDTSFSGLENRVAAEGRHSSRGPPGAPSPEVPISWAEAPSNAAAVKKKKKPKSPNLLSTYHRPGTLLSASNESPWNSPQSPVVGWPLVILTLPVLRFLQGRAAHAHSCPTDA